MIRLVVEDSSGVRARADILLRQIKWFNLNIMAQPGSSQMRPQGTSSVTQTTTETSASPILHLRPSKRKLKKKPLVRWTEDTVDNEHMNKKKTKICCIFHPQRQFDDGSSCESCSSSDSSSDGSDTEDSKPNAYEHQPHYKNQSKVPQ